MRSFIEFAMGFTHKCGDRDHTPRAPSSGFLSHDAFSAELVKLLVSVWSASGTYPHDAAIDNRSTCKHNGTQPKLGEAHMDEIVCANTAFRYWRCPPQVRDLYPRLPNSEDGWRALSQAPFVTDVLKTPIIAVASPGCCNHHSGLRSTIRWEGAQQSTLI